MFHRLGALIASIFIAALSFKLLRAKYKIGFVVLGLLGIQIILGITNVLAALPLPISLMHNAVAALLLLSLVNVLSRNYAT